MTLKLQIFGLLTFQYRTSSESFHLNSSAIAANGESSKEKHICGDVLLRHVS